MYRWWPRDGGYLGKIVIVFLQVWFGESKLLWILNTGMLAVVLQWAVLDLNQ